MKVHSTIRDIGALAKYLDLLKKILMALQWELAPKSEIKGGDNIHVLAVYKDECMFLTIQARKGLLEDYSASAQVTLTLDGDQVRAILYEDNVPARDLSNDIEAISDWIASIIPAELKKKKTGKLA